MVVSPPVWEIRNLREVVTKLVDGSHNPPPKQDSGLPMLSARNIDRGQVLFDDYRLISEDAFVSENARTRIAAGDVLLTIVGTIGRTAVVPDGSQPFSLQRSVAVLTPVANLLSKFLCYQLQSPAIQRHFEANARGTAQKGVYLKTLGQTPIVLPPVNVQTEIVAEIEKQFSRLDEAVANLQRVKANLKRYKASVLKDAVEGRLVPTEVIASAGELSPVWVPISNAIRTLDQGWSPQCESEPRSSSDYWAVIKTTAIQSMEFRAEENKLLPPGLVSRAHLSLMSGDLLITRAGPRSRVGVTCLVKSDFPKLMICDKAYRLRAKLNVAIPAYLEVVLNSPTLLDGLDELKSGISDSGLNLTQKRFGELLVPLPSLAVQQCIVDEVDRRLSLVRSVAAEVDANLKRAQALRQATLAKAFSNT